MRTIQSHIAIKGTLAFSVKLTFYLRVEISTMKQLEKNHQNIHKTSVLQCYAMALSDPRLLPAQGQEKTNFTEQNSHLRKVELSKQNTFLALSGGLIFLVFVGLFLWKY